jgi:hypothetical protein
MGKTGAKIADLTFSRKKTGLAVVGLNLDQAPSKQVMDELAHLEFVHAAYYLRLPELPADEEE